MKLSKASFHYDAFISYAHEDAETAKWLRRLLERYWVPGRKRRRVFLDSGSLSAGGLSTGITDALSQSRYLIVCCSSSAIKSLWVDREVCTYVALNRPEAILICRVGEEADNQVPASIQRLEAENREAFFIPDLRGDSKGWNRINRRHKRDDALALLAPLVGFKNKDSLLDQARRWRRLLLTAGAVAVFLIAVLAGAWRWWLTTPVGRFHSTVNALVDAKSTETIEDLSLVDTLISLGRLGQESALRQVGGLLPAAGGMAYLGLAAGLASLPQPDCAAAEALLARAEPDALRQWPEAALVMANTCDQKWLDKVIPSLKDQDDVVTWGRQLVRSGHTGQARALLEHTTLSGAQRFELRLWLAGHLPEIASSREDFDAWADQQLSGSLKKDQDYETMFGVAGMGSHDILSEVVRHLTNLDIHGRLSRPEAAWLADLGVMVSTRLDPLYTNNWSLRQALAAALSGMGRPEDARTLTDTSEILQKRFQVGAACQAEGWAWRSLAHYRLGQEAEAAIDVRRAEVCGGSGLPQSRTWEEWHTIVLTYVLSGRWKAAFDAASQPRDKRARLLTQARLVTLWELRYSERQQ